jgi:hypothetical protein
MVLTRRRLIHLSSAFLPPHECRVVVPPRWPLLLVLSHFVEQVQHQLYVQVEVEVEVKNKRFPQQETKSQSKGFCDSKSNVIDTDMRSMFNNFMIRVTITSS